ncbi:rRNA maturation RNase YbeY [Ktedonospora formicarum]|uniref:Endoribonuclease YbeY n=1 Tax=Ktedonospora formicarum TaxID=2778364 RepID=A0A8J3HYL7_9CHLR|nr:rRNA maturation RNase YbeY [Ktedonospora formicarum]GHO43027.1 endoribonuclease YbeY [Ktedonospora formicarum]
MHEHPLIELYVTIEDAQLSAEIEQALEHVNLDEVAERTLREVGITEEIMLTLLVTDDNGIRDMNKQYREIDKPTDVLSFPLLNEPLVNAPEDQLWPPRPVEGETQASTPDFITPPGNVTNLGDIVMSWPTLERQAREAGHSTLHECLYLLSHGVLHLVGYDDHTEAGYQAMVSIQQRVLNTLTQRKS